MAVNTNCWISQGGQSIENNNTYCVFSGDVTATGSSYNNYGCNGSGVFDGVAFSFSTTIPRNTTKRMFDIGRWVGHQPDGTRTVSGSFSLATGISAGTVSGSASKVLTTIPRASTISLTADGDGRRIIGKTYTINIARASSGFRHLLEWWSGGQSGTIATNVESSANFTLPDALYKSTEFNSSGMGVVGLRCHTYSGGTLLGSSEIYFNAFIPDTDAPNISSVTATVINPFGALALQGKSSVRITVSASGIHNTTIKSYSISGQGISYSGTSNTATSSILTSAGNQTYKVVVTDSRGRAATKNVNVNVTAYSKPTLTMSYYRATAGSVRDDVTGMYIYIKPTFTYTACTGNSIKAKSIQIDSVTKNTTFNSGTGILFGTYAINTTHKITCSITDVVGNTVTLTGEVGIGAIPFNINAAKKGVGIGMYAPKDQTGLFIAYPIYGNYQSNSSWRNGLGLLNMTVNKSGSQNNLLVATDSSGNRRYSIELLNGTTPLTNDWMRIYVGAAFLEIRNSALYFQKSNGSSTRLDFQYTTAEQWTGRYWIDGKMIYTKTINIGALPNNSITGIKLVPHGISNYNTTMPGFPKGIAKNGTSELPLPYIHPWSIGDSITVEREGANIKVSTNSNKSSYTGWITIEYTKTS